MRDTHYQPGVLLYYYYTMLSLKSASKMTKFISERWKGGDEQG